MSINLVNISLQGDIVVPLYPRSETYEMNPYDLETIIPDLDRKQIENFISWAEKSDYVSRFHPFEFEYDFDIQKHDPKYMERLKVPEKFKPVFQAAIKLALSKENDSCLTLRFYFPQSFLNKYEVYKEKEKENEE